MGHIIVSSSTSLLRERLANALSSAGHSLVTMPRLGAEDVARLTSREGPEPVLVVETGTDVAAMCQIVYGIHGACRSARRRRPAVFGVVTGETLERNPSLGVWLIDGSAALVALLVVGGATDWIGDLERLVARVAT
ncbi:MAG: hypothetical protein IT208_08760 [Chthonomonadales bacterium]|nr:hypothetical protein [Chthonomonadales bacterium]